MKYVYLLALSMITMCLFGCVNVEKEEKNYLKNIRKDNNEMSRLGQADIDDDLNATERKAVDPIFEKNRKESNRMDKAIFGALNLEE